MPVPIFTTCKYRLVPNTVIVISPYLLAEVESRTQGSRPRTQKKIRGQGHKKNPRPRTAFPRTDTLEAKDRNEAKDQGHKRKCSPKKRSSQKFFRRSQKKKKKKVFKKFFQAISTKKVFQKIFQALHKILTIQKIVLS